MDAWVANPKAKDNQVIMTNNKGIPKGNLEATLKKNLQGLKKHAEPQYKRCSTKTYNSLKRNNKLSTVLNDSGNQGKAAMCN